MWWPHIFTYLHNFYEYDLHLAGVWKPAGVLSSVEEQKHLQLIIAWKRWCWFSRGQGIRFRCSWSPNCFLSAPLSSFHSFFFGSRCIVQLHCSSTWLEGHCRSKGWQIFFRWCNFFRDWLRLWLCPKRACRPQMSRPGGRELWPVGPTLDQHLITPSSENGDALTAVEPSGMSVLCRRRRKPFLDRDFTISVSTIHVSKRLCEGPWNIAKGYEQVTSKLWPKSCQLDKTAKKLL